MADNKVTVFICGRGRATKERKMKSWRGILRDVNGCEIQSLTTQSDKYDQAFQQLLAQAQDIPGAFMVHLGLGQRIVKAQA